MARSEAFKHSCYLSTSCNRWGIHENTSNFDERPLERMKEALDSLEKPRGNLWRKPVAQEKGCRVGLSCGRAATYRHVVPTYRHVAPTKRPRVFCCPGTSRQIPGTSRRLFSVQKTSICLKNVVILGSCGSWL